MLILGTKGPAFARQRNPQGRNTDPLDRKRVLQPCTSGSKVIPILYRKMVFEHAPLKSAAALEPGRLSFQAAFQRIAAVK